MAKGKGEARGGALEVKGFPMQNGSVSFSTADSGKENTLRGGSGTSQETEGKLPGGDFSPATAASGYPSNK